MGSAFDLKALTGYLGQEAILALYQREAEMSFLLVSEIGVKEKIEIAALAAVVAAKPSFEWRREDYNEFTINTITGYPRDFSYAFIGKIGLLSLNPSLIKDTIDVYTKKKNGFGNAHTMGTSLRMNYDSNGSTAFVNLPRLVTALESVRELNALSEKVEFWSCSNRYRNGLFRSQHEIKWQTSWKSDSLNPRRIDANLLSALPARTAFSHINHNLNLSGFWEWVTGNVAIQRGQNRIDLSRHLGTAMTLALLSSTSESAITIPSIIIAIPITNRMGLQSDLISLRQEKLVVNHKQLQFSRPENYRGVKFQPVRYRFGLIFFLEGAYAIVNDHWIISTTRNGLKSVIEASSGSGKTLADLNFPPPSDELRSQHTLIQPGLIIPELKRLVPIISFVAQASENMPNLDLMQHTIDNILPLETLGLVSAGTDFKNGGLNFQIQVVVSVNE